MQLLLQQQNFADQLLHLSELTNSANLLCEYFVGLSQWGAEEIVVATAFCRRVATTFRFNPEWLS